MIFQVSQDRANEQYILIHSGKTSKIYKVRRKRDGEILALKVLSKCNIYVLESNAFDNERFILSRANHPNIINLIGSDSKLMYQQLELELAPDGSVRVRLLSDYSYYLMSTNMVH